MKESDKMAAVGFGLFVATVLLIGLWIWGRSAASLHEPEDPPKPTRYIDTAVNAHTVVDHNKEIERRWEAAKAAHEEEVACWKAREEKRVADLAAGNTPGYPFCRAMAWVGFCGAIITIVFGAGACQESSDLAEKGK